MTGFSNYTGCLKKWEFVFWDHFEKTEPPLVSGIISINGLAMVQNQINKHVHDLFLQSTNLPENTSH